MSMPGFYFHISCTPCAYSSRIYPLLVFPDLFSSNLVLPGWRRQHRCFVSVSCDFGESRLELERDRQAQASLAASFCSPGLTVGLPTFTITDDGIIAAVEPPPDCPRCGQPAAVVVGEPPRFVSPPLEADVERVDLSIDELFQEPVERLRFSVRTSHALDAAHVFTIGQLARRCHDLLELRGFGEVAFAEVRYRLRELVRFQPEWLSWRDGSVLKLAQAVRAHVHDDRLDSVRLSILADALEEAGCNNPDILLHLRRPGPHGKDCWLLQSLLRQFQSEASRSS